MNFNLWINQDLMFGESLLLNLHLLSGIRICLI